MNGTHDIVKLFFGGTTMLLTCAGLVSVIGIKHMRGEASDFKADMQKAVHDLNNYIVEVYKQSDEYSYRKNLYSQIAKDPTKPIDVRKDAVQSLINNESKSYILSHMDEFKIEFSPIYDKGKIDALKQKKDFSESLYNNINKRLENSERIAILSTLGATITGTYATAFVNQDMYPNEEEENNEL